MEAAARPQFESCSPRADGEGSFQDTVIGELLFDEDTSDEEEKDEEE